MNMAGHHAGGDNWIKSGSDYLLAMQLKGKATTSKAKDLGWQHLNIITHGTKLRKLKKRKVSVREWKDEIW